MLRAALCVLVAFSIAFSCTLSRLAMAHDMDQPAQTQMAGKMIMSMPCHGGMAQKADTTQKTSPSSQQPDCCKIMCHAVIGMDVALALPFQLPDRLAPGAFNMPGDAEPGHDSPPPRPVV